MTEIFSPQNTFARASKRLAMHSPLTATFPHRHNADGSHVAICRRCFATVASAKDEGELELYEVRHKCDRLTLPKPFPCARTGISSSAPSNVKTSLLQESLPGKRFVVPCLNDPAGECISRAGHGGGRDSQDSPRRSTRYSANYGLSFAALFLLLQVRSAPKTMQRPAATNVWAEVPISSV